MAEMRYAMVAVNKEWVIERDPSKIKEGTIFRLFEPDGTPIKGAYDEAEVFIAKKDAYKNEDGIWTVEVSY